MAGIFDIEQVTSSNFKFDFPLKYFVYAALVDLISRATSRTPSFWITISDLWFDKRLFSVKSKFYWIYLDQSLSCLCWQELQIC